MNEKDIQNLVENLSTQDAVNEALGLNNVKSGGEVAVVADPTFPYDGLRGRVKGPVPEGKSGTVKVAFPNGTVVDLAVNQLVPV